MKIISIISLLLSSSVLAESTCIGKVSTLSIGRGGVLMVGGPGGLPDSYLCNVHTKNNDVQPEACKIFYSQLLAAQAQDVNVKITFNPGYSSCSEIKAWSWATNVNWIIVNK